MTAFEIAYSLLEFFTPTLYSEVRKRLRRFTASQRRPLDLLDIGGRKSHYTIGLPVRVTISELPRTTATQHQLHLGLTDPLVTQLQNRRSNVERVIWDDMVYSSLDSHSFDGALAIEVLEHVEQDHLFLNQVYRVIRPGGFFIMTTPNGDFIRNTNPDHKRHYRLANLRTLVADVFDEVEETSYAVVTGRVYQRGLRSWSWRQPLSTIVGMLANRLNRIASASTKIQNQSTGTAHLIVVARKNF